MLLFRRFKILIVLPTAATFPRPPIRQGSVLIRATRPWSAGPLYFTSELFLPRTVIAARRRSGAPSKVYQWLGPRCRHKITLKHFANPSPNFYRGSKTAKFGLDSQNQLPLTGSSFETEQHIGNLKHVSGAQMIALNTDVEIWPIPSLIFTQGVKKCKIWHLRRCGFETKQRIAYLFQVS